MIWPGMSAAVLCRGLGILMIVCGIFKLCGYWAKDLYRLAFQFDLAFGILLCGVGLILLFRSDSVLRFLNLAIGLVVFADGLFKIQTAVDAKRFGLGKWWLIAVAAVAASIFGFLLIIDPIRRTGVNTIMVLLGLALLLEGILNLCVAVYTIRVTEQKKYILEENND